MNALLLFAQNAPDSDGGFGILGGALALIALFWVVAIAATIFQIWMLIDAVINEPTTEQKILWVLVIAFTHIIGAVLYLVVRKMGKGQSTAVR
jgi:hypothetical protein